MLIKCYTAHGHPWKIMDSSEGKPIQIMPIYHKMKFSVAFSKLINLKEGEQLELFCGSGITGELILISNHIF